jgi:hypothetical protein
VISICIAVVVIASHSGDGLKETSSFLFYLDRLISRLGIGIAIKHGGWKEITTITHVKQ